MNKYIFSITLIIISLSCRKELDIDIPSHERKIVLNSIVMNDSVFSAYVFRSNHVQDNRMELLYLNNASVNVFENGNLLEKLALDSSGYYLGSSVIAQAGHEYEFMVSVPNLKSVIAKAEVLPQIPILSIDSSTTGTFNEYYMYYGEEANEYTSYNVKFQDIPNEKNYYRLRTNAPMIADTFFYYDNERDTLIKDIYYSASSYYSEDRSIEVWDWYDGYYYFSDILFDGDEYKFEIRVLSSNKSIDEFDEKGATSEIIVSLEHISHEMFEYMKSVDMQSETEGLEMFYQAVPVYNNIENGFGILGSANVSVEPIP